MKPQRIILAAAAIGACAAACHAGELFRVLVFTKTAGFRHTSIPNGVQMVNELGAEHCFAVEHTEDSTQFSAENLARFRVVIFLCTTGDILNNEQQTAFEAYIGDGGGWVGVHSASDTEYSWPFYGQLLGAYFSSHPQPQTAQIDIEDADHPSTETLPDPWTRFDEWYNFQTNPRPLVRVLATLNESTYSGGTMGDDHPIIWCREFAGGRSWYTAGGHTEASYAEPHFRRHVLGGGRPARTRARRRQRRQPDQRRRPERPARPLRPDRHPGHFRRLQRRRRSQRRGPQRPARELRRRLRGLIALRDDQ